MSPNCAWHIILPAPNTCSILRRIFDVSVHEASPTSRIRHLEVPRVRIYAQLRGGGIRQLAMFRRNDAWDPAVLLLASDVALESRESAREQLPTL